MRTSCHAAKTKGVCADRKLDEETKRLDAQRLMRRHSREVRDCPLCGLDAQKDATVSAAMEGGGAVLPWT